MKLKLAAFVLIALSGCGEAERPYAQFRDVPATCKELREQGDKAIKGGADSRAVNDQVNMHCPAGFVVPVANPWPSEYKRP